jgi:P27 family predicted phage terminase small subunit
MQRGRKSQAALGVVGFQMPDDRPSPVFDPPPPPDHLGEPERRIWADAHADYSLATNISTAVLATALEAHQRARECREVILADGATVSGRDGQVRAHPLLAVERDARAAWLAGIKALGLEL